MTTPALPQHTPIATTFRGGHPENIHYGSFAVVNAEGKLLASAGDIASPIFTRSSLKPFQAMPLIAKAADALNLSEEDIALLCASHSGEPMHTERAAALLAKIGASERNLACGCHHTLFLRRHRPDAHPWRHLQPFATQLLRQTHWHAAAGPCAGPAIGWLPGC